MRKLSWKKIRGGGHFAELEIEIMERLQLWVVTRSV